jgi:hypothetical protein
MASRLVWQAGYCALEATRTQGARRTLTPSPCPRKTWLISRLMIPLPANFIFLTPENSFRYDNCRRACDCAFESA